MLASIIRAALADPDSPIATDEITELVLSRIPEDQIRKALAEALPLVIMQVRAARNRQLLRDPELPVPGDPVAGRNRSGHSGNLYASPRASLLMEERLLSMTITGQGGRAVRLHLARVADIRSEIDVSRRKGETLITRADVFDDMLHEMARTRTDRAGQLPGESLRKYALRLQELYAG